MHNNNLHKFEMLVNEDFLSTGNKKRNKKKSELSFRELILQDPAWRETTIDVNKSGKYNMKYKI